MSDPRPEDRSWIETVERELRPVPMDARASLAFRRGLEERLARRDARRRFVIPVLLNAAAAAAAVFWLLRADAPTPIGVGRDDAQIAEVDAWVDPDADGGALGDAADYLPGDYLVLATLLDDAAP
jgi:hypothetical protein